MRPGKLLLKPCLLLLAITGVITSKAQITASFNATPENGCSPLVVRFTDQSTGSPTQWRWDLGNGTISFLQNPAATYFTPGKYTVKLVARNASGIDSITKTEYIEVFAKPVVNFSASATNGCYPLPVDFTDLTNPGSGTIISWLWDFGDGATSTEQNPSHTYNSDRNFNVTLQVRNSNGCISTLTKTSMIQISTGVLARFTNDNPQTCTAPVTINFQNQSTGTGAVSYQWDFGDGNTSTLLSPSHTYTGNGTYTVKLIVTNGNGCTDTIVKPNAVTVGSVNAAFTSPATTCQGSPTTFTNGSVPNPASVQWFFGDGGSSSLLNPVYSYNTSGTFSVKMVANFGACTDSFLRTITVFAKPTAVFSTTDTASCKAPFTVNFSNQSVSAVSYLWDFGDNTTSTLQNPSHVYNSTGSFTVKLSVVNANGCTDSIIKSSYINIQRPKASITNIPDSNCVPFTKTFDLSVTTPEPVASYLWNFGDGGTSTDAAPTYTYNTEGAYNVSVIIITTNGCTDTARVTRGIITNNKPTANFSATPASTCAKTSVSFTDLSTGGPTRWLWEFGDSTTATVQNPTHLYVDTGLFTIKLKIWKGGCLDSFVRQDYVQINPPIAKFNIAMNCKRPFERVFTDQSIGAEEWQWNFGDGNTSTTQSPTHIYAAPGVYTITLRVVNNTYGCDYTTTKQVTVVDVTTTFSTPDTAICRGSNITFTSAASPSNVSLFQWNFGGGTPSLFSVTNSYNYTYNNSGTYTVSLITTDIAGCKDTVIKTAYIYVSGPVAKFSPSVSGACLNNAITFRDSSTTGGSHPITQWDWNYGDNSSEILTAPPFQHLYNTAGTYVVKMKITDSKGCTDSTQLTTALIISKPEANFSTVDTFTCPDRQVRFVNQSSGPSLNYLWYFGDNTTSTTQNPIHSYSANGAYSVKLVITDQFGCTDSITKNNYINVSTPTALFIMSDSISNCPPLVTTLTNQSSGAQSIKWDFGDSTYSTSSNPVHFYNYPGIYYITLTVTGTGGCTTTYQRRVVVKGPEGSFTYTPLTGCNPVSVDFAAVTNGRNTFVWDYNDGTTIPTNDSVLSHTYTHPGRYIPKLILIDQAGCQVPIIGNDTITVSSVSTNFSFNNKLLCDSGIVSFADSSIATLDTINTYQWNFGDGNFSNSKNPVYHYSSTGIFYPSLVTITQKGCTDTLTSSVPLRVVASPDIDIISSANGCAPLMVTFNGQLVVPDSSTISWQWDFANGNTSSSVSPAAQNYSAAGLYHVTLKGTNSSGCIDTVTKTIEAYSIPVVSAGADFTLCKGSSRTIDATGADTYSWSPSAGLSCIDCANPSTTTTSNITYTVTGTSAQGCSARDSVSVNVKERFVMTRSASDSVCRGSSKKMTASGAHTYEWTPSASLDNATTSSPTATPDTTTIYRVVGTDDINCFKDTGFITIKVNPLPTVEAGVDKTINVGQSVDLMPVISADVTQVIWLPTFGLDRSSWPGITVKPTENTEYTVEAKNRGGCLARDRVTVFVICNGSNIFVPNTFSPNADGVNDVFYPRGTGLFKIRNMRIFTRWGEMVFDKTNFDANNSAYGWDGTSKGKGLAPDVFVYTLEVMCENGSVLTYRGNIALVK